MPYKKAIYDIFSPASAPDFAPAEPYSNYTPEKLP